MQTCATPTDTRRKLPEGEVCVHKNKKCRFDFEKLFFIRGTSSGSQEPARSHSGADSTHTCRPRRALRLGIAVLRTRTRSVGAAALDNTHACFPARGPCFQTLPGAAVGAGLEPGVGTATRPPESSQEAPGAAPWGGGGGGGKRGSQPQPLMADRTHVEGRQAFLSTPRPGLPPRREHWPGRGHGSACAGEGPALSSFAAKDTGRGCPAHPRPPGTGAPNGF